jgi:hypothetical protein
MVQIDPINFHQSISKELMAIKDKVRSLIGDSHWGITPPKCTTTNSFSL